jgi:hypothetical protein
MFELFFCPVHGILRPANWPFIGAAIPMLRMSYFSVRDYISALIKNYRFNQLRKNGAF